MSGSTKWVVETAIKYGAVFAEVRFSKWRLAGRLYRIVESNRKGSLQRCQRYI